MKLGPKGTGVTKTESVTAKREWNFPREFLIARLGLPEDAVLYVRVPGGGDWSNTNLVIGTDGNCLTAEATEVRKPREPKKEGNS